ncbi:hypothetical protein Poly30_02310 [Planctomycetes bacterium Poly30]|uniref:Sorbosone dehydrogenase family protein n=1 Tax=Saltatorellus ferox TaxID=2528018 RepID=A0A518EKX3_9BACT|nr:hypothetical protein Poly30_02310 [Planctomycetes bacterium Poly30]
MRSTVLASLGLLAFSLSGYWMQDDAAAPARDSAFAAPKAGPPPFIPGTHIGEWKGPN